MLRRFLIAKAEQFSLFGGGAKAGEKKSGTREPVKAPGSHGGVGYYDEHGAWQYGQRPTLKLPPREAPAGNPRYATLDATIAAAAPEPPAPETYPCPRCRGTGKGQTISDPEACLGCNGTGKVTVELPRTDFEVPEGKLDRLREQIAKLNTRAKRMKLGPDVWEPITLTVTGERMVERRDEHGEPTGFLRKLILVHVVGKTLKYPGWEFLARVEHVPNEDGTFTNIVNATGSARVPERFRNTGPTCDQCHATRRRLDTFIVAKDDGTTRQIGRDCLRDYLGHENPEHLANAAELLGDLHRALDDDSDEREPSGGERTDYVDTRRLLGVAAYAIRAWGWTPKSKAGFGTTSTYDDVMLGLFPPKEHPEDGIKPSEADLADADAALAWATGEAPFGKSPEKLSDFEWNVYATLRQPGLRAVRHAGIAAAGMMAYLREQGRKIEREAKAKGGGNKHVGEVGKRDTFTLTLTAVLDLGEGQYGTTYLCKFVDQDGNDLTWFTGKNPTREVFTDSYWKIGDAVLTQQGEYPEETPGRMRLYWELERGKGKKKTVTRYSREELEAGKDGAILVPSATAPEWAIGDTWEVSATVKKHDSFRGVAQTSLSRVKQVKRVGGDPIAKAGGVARVEPWMLAEARAIERERRVMVWRR